jgi:hypothetical protein
MTSSYDAAVIGIDLIEDPRLLQLPRGIRLLHLEAIVWCKARRTDGAIVEPALRRMTDEDEPTDAAAQLVAAGLWERSGDGWQVVDFTAHQLSRRQVEQRQADNRRRYEEWRDKKRNASPTDEQRVGNGAASQPASLPARNRTGRVAGSSRAAGAGKRRGGSPPRPRKAPARVLDHIHGYTGRPEISDEEYGELYALGGSEHAVIRALEAARPSGSVTLEKLILATKIQLARSR